MKKCKLIGNIIGPFEILSTRRDETPGGSKITRYECKCIKCGNISYKQLHHIKGFKGDGCLECTEKLTAKPRMTIEERNYNNYKCKIEKQTDKEFNLSFEEFNVLTKQNCKYCGEVPVFPERFKDEFKNRELVFFNGIDRIDSSIGYNINNCVPCCAKCNRMKSDLEINVFLDHIKKIFEFNQSSTTSRKT